MKLHYIKLKNYRQYRETKIVFSTSQDQHITIIQGNNGVGKSNLLNAITWCLYGEERHIRDEDRGLPMVNEKVYHALTTGEQAIVQVELALGGQQIEYTITRTAHVLKRLDDQVAVREPLGPIVMYLMRGNWRRSPQPSYTINSLLPAEISHFFFFDGEQLDNFFEGNSTERVQTGVINVSQIDLLDRALQHLEQVQKEYRRKAQKLSPKIEKITQTYENTEKELAKSQKELKLYEQNREASKKKLEKVDKQLRNSNIELVRTLQQNRDIQKQQVKQYESRLDLKRDKSIAGLLQLAAPVYAHLALKQALELFEEQEANREEPAKVHPSFFQTLLATERCICGHDLHEGSSARAHVVHCMNEMTSSVAEIDQRIDPQSNLQAMLQQIPRQISEHKELAEEVQEIEAQIKKIKIQLKESSTQLKQFGAIQVKEIQLLQQQQRKYEEAIEKSSEQIGSTQRKIILFNKTLAEVKQILNRALEDDKRLKELQARLKLLNTSHDLLRDIRNDLLTEVREQIEQKTEEYFRQLIWKKETYERVKINETYQVRVFNTRGMSSLGSLSAGEQQVLGLAFMAALGTVSGFKAPVVIDTPIGRISGKPRNNIAESLPTYLSDTQLILLMTDTEYTPEVQSRLKAHIGKEYQLNFIESEAQTKVTAT